MPGTTIFTPAQMEHCAERCHECQDECLRTIVYCLGLGGEHASLEHQTLLADCVAICGASHNLLHRRSLRHVHTCRACAQICAECARHCERFAEDETMKRCADVCRQCADACEAMSAST